MKIKFQMFRKIIFWSAFTFTILVLSNLFLWEYLKDIFKDKYTIPDIKLFYFSLFPDFLEDKVLTKINFYLSTASVTVYSILIFIQTKIALFKTVLLVLLMILNLLLMLLMLFWKYI